MIDKAVRQIALRIRIEPHVHIFVDDLALDIQRPRGDIHHILQTAEEIHLVLRQICDTRHVDGHYADGAGILSRAEVASVLLPELTQIEPEAAAHGSDIAGLHITVDIVREIRSSVLRRHRKEQPVVLRVRPVEVLGDAVCRYRICEAAPVIVALHHDLDEGLVDHRHLLDAVSVGEVHLFASDQRGQIFEVVRACPVQRNVGKRRLSAPSGRDIHTEDKCLHRLLYLVI